MAKWDGLSSSTPKRIILGAGALYRNYGQTASDAEADSDITAWATGQTITAGDKRKTGPANGRQYWEALDDHTSASGNEPGSGADYADHWRSYTLSTGTGGEELLGATRGGSTFTVMREDRDVELDGTYGPIKELKRTIMHTAQLSATVIELSEKLWRDITRGTVADDGTHRKITPKLNILSTDYITNVALVAEVLNAEENTMGSDADRGACVIVIKNTLVEGEVGFTIDDDDEGLAEVTFKAHYDLGVGAEDVPYEILWPAVAA